MHIFTFYFFSHYKLTLLEETVNWIMERNPYMSKWQVDYLCNNNYLHCWRKSFSMILINCEKQVFHEKNVVLAIYPIRFISFFIANLRRTLCKSVVSSVHLCFIQNSSVLHFIIIINNKKIHQIYFTHFCCGYLALKAFVYCIQSIIMLF